MRTSPRSAWRAITRPSFGLGTTRTQGGEIQQAADSSTAWTPLRLTAGILAASLPSLVDPGAIARGAALHAVASGPSPYWVPEHALLLYLWIPLVVLSSFAAVLGPGLMLGAASRNPRSTAVWLITGLAISTLVLSLTIELAEGLAGRPITGRGFIGLADGLTLAAGIWAWGRWHGQTGGWTDGGPRGRAAAWAENPLVPIVIGTVVILVGLLPKFLWESFNGDGAHAYESARLLLHAPVPFWSPAAGTMANYPGITTFLSSYPVAWFVRAFGEVEAAARLPYLLFLGAGLYPGLLALIEHGRERVGTDAKWVLWLGLLAFTVVMAFSATYNNYHADIALPGAQDVLIIAWFLGLAWATVADRPAWAVVFAGLTYFTSPAGTILLGFWILASAVFLRPLPRRALAAAIATVVVGVAIGKIAPTLLRAASLPVPGVEHEAGGLAKRLLNIQWRDWHRLIYFAVPGGILPAATLLLFRRQDRLTRAITAVTVAQFAFFYFQSRMSLHYFAPAMILPLVVCWRTVPVVWPSRVVPMAVALTALLALGISWPESAAPATAARDVGLGIEDALPGYAQASSEAQGRSQLLGALFAKDSHKSVPDSAYGGSPLAWFYYAHGGRRTDGQADGRTDGPAKAYRLQADTAPPPPGGRLVASGAGVALFVLDESRLDRDRRLHPPVTIARIYRIPKKTLFTG